MCIGIQWELKLKLELNHHIAKVLFLFSATISYRWLEIILPFNLSPSLIGCCFIFLLLHPFENSTEAKIYGNFALDLLKMYSKTSHIADDFLLVAKICSSFLKFFGDYNNISARWYTNEYPLWLFLSILASVFHLPGLYCFHCSRFGLLSFLLLFTFQEIFSYNR